MFRDFNQNGYSFRGATAMVFTAALGVLGFLGGRFGQANSPGQPATGVQQTPPTGTRLPNEGEMPSLAGATGWLNSRSLAAADLRGKVVVIGFWTYSCINWRRQLPYV